MPYLAPEAPIPITSCAPRLAEMNASPVIHGGSERPERKKSVLVRVSRAQRPADAEHGGEVDGHDDVVDRREVRERVAFHREARGRECVGALRDAGASGAVVPESAGNMLPGGAAKVAGARWGVWCGRAEPRRAGLLSGWLRRAGRPRAFPASSLTGLHAASLAKLPASLLLRPYAPPPGTPAACDLTRASTACAQALTPNAVGPPPPRGVGGPANVDQDRFSDATAPQERRWGDGVPAWWPHA